MRLDLEYHAVTLANVHQPGIFLAGFYQHFLSLTGQGFQPFDGVLVTAVFLHAAESAVH
ncbi:MAG: hypothetical protein U0T56_11625 [Ferruginibacter sp.]